jgi:hypothetical protein
VKKLTEQPASIVQTDIDTVLAAGWDESALGDAIAVCAFFNMANRLADGHGLKALRAERLAELRGDTGYPGASPGRNRAESEALSPAAEWPIIYATALRKIGVKDPTAS